MRAACGGVNAVFGILALSVVVDAMFLYAFVYERASEIPELLVIIKRNLGARVGMLRSGREKAVLCREVSSIPSVGLRVGNSHMLERMSTPIFI